MPLPVKHRVFLLRKHGVFLHFKNFYIPLCIKFHVYVKVFPYCFPYRPILQYSLFCQLIIKLLHPIGTILLHFLGVYIQGKLGCRMSQIGLYGFDIVIGIQGP